MSSPNHKSEIKEKCPACSKRVYAAERISAEASGDYYSFHKSCFRCASCNSILKPGGYATEGKKFYCKAHLPKAAPKRAPVILTPVIVETVQHVVLSPHVATPLSSTPHISAEDTSSTSSSAAIKLVINPVTNSSSNSSSPPSPGSAPLGTSSVPLGTSPITNTQPTLAAPPSTSMATPSVSVTAASTSAASVPPASAAVPVPTTTITNGSWSPPHPSSLSNSMDDLHAPPVVPPLQIGRKVTRPALPPLASPDSSSLSPHQHADYTMPPPVQPQPRSLKDWLQTAPSAAKLAQLQTMKLEALQKEAKRDKDVRAHGGSPNRELQPAPSNGSGLSHSTSSFTITELANASQPDKPLPKRAMMSPIRIRTALPDALKHNPSPARLDMMMSPRGIDDGEMFSPRLEETQLRSSRDPSTPAIVQDVVTLRTELTKAQKDARSLKKEVRRREEDLKQLRRDVRDQAEALNQLRTFLNQLDSEKHLLAVEAKVVAQEARQQATEARQLAVEANRAKDEAAQARREVTDLRQEVNRLQQRLIELENRPAALPPAHATAAVAAAAVGRARGDAGSLMARALENDVAQSNGSAFTSPRAAPAPAPSPAPTIVIAPPVAPTPSAAAPAAHPATTSAPIGAPVFTPAYPPPKSSAAANALKKSEDDPKKLAAEFPAMRKISSEELTTLREQSSGRKVRDFYEIGKRLAKGGQSIVFLGTQKATGKKVAIKKIKRTADKDEEDALWREISLLKTLSHPNIVKFYEFFEEENFLYLIMEYIDGKELFEKIVDKGAYSERDAALVVRQVVDAIGYMHANRIAHRDIKPENILSSGSGPNEIVKLADFGLSKNFDAGPLQTLCGSSLYIAPELLNDSKYDNSVDLWSLGVVVYILLCGQSPWKSPPTEANKLLQDIINCRWDFDKEEWKYVSPEAKDFISRLLRKEPSERMTAAQCLAHPWLMPSGSKVAPHSTKQLNNTLTRLKDFTYGRKTAKSLLDLFDPPSAHKDDEKT